MEQQATPEVLGLEKLEDLISEADLAKLFGVSKQTVAKWRYEGGLSYVKAGIKSFFIEADVLQWLAKRRVDKTTQG